MMKKRPKSMSSGPMNDSARRRRGDVLGGEGEHDRDDRLPAELRGLRQPEVPVAPQLDVVVEEPDEPHAGERRHGEQPARRVRRAEDQGRDEVAAEGREDDRDPAHRRRPALHHVGLRAVVADELAVAAVAEEADDQRRADERQDQREARGDEDGPHRAAGPAPRRSRARHAAVRGDEGVGDPLEADRAAGLDEDGVAVAEPRGPRARRGPRRRPPRRAGVVGPAPPGAGGRRRCRGRSPRRRRRARRARARRTRGPTSSWAAGPVSPSSPIVPRTAQRRPGTDIRAKVDSAASMDAGLAL
jgi:hypothetical protein